MMMPQWSMAPACRPARRLPVIDEAAAFIGGGAVSAGVIGGAS